MAISRKAGKNRKEGTVMPRLARRLTAAEQAYL